MDELYVVKDGKVVIWDGVTLGGKKISRDEVLEAFGQKVVDEIQRFGSFTIKKN